MVGHLRSLNSEDDQCGMASPRQETNTEKALERIQRIDNEIRGNYLVATSYLEHNIVEAIASHFYPNPRSGEVKRRDLLWFILMNHTFSFKSKVATYTALIRKYYPDIWQRHSKEIKKLNAIANYRNVLAHAASALPEEDLMKKSVD